MRPHDLALHDWSRTATEAMVERVLHLGFEVRVELIREDGEQVSVQITRDEAERLELEPGQIVFVGRARDDGFSAGARHSGSAMQIVQ